MLQRHAYAPARARYDMMLPEAAFRAKRPYVEFAAMRITRVVMPLSPCAADSPYALRADDMFIDIAATLLWRCLRHAARGLMLSIHVIFDDAARLPYDAMPLPRAIQDTAMPGTCHYMRRYAIRYAAPYSYDFAAAFRKIFHFFQYIISRRYYVSPLSPPRLPPLRCRAVVDVACRCLHSAHATDTIHGRRLLTTLLQPHILSLPITSADG